MTDRPILYSGPMVRAQLEGRKTQTRRVVKPLTKRHPIKNLAIDGMSSSRNYSGRQNDPGSWGFVGAEDGEDMPLADWIRELCPYGKTGDLLWVRETWMDLRGTGIEHRPTPDSPIRRYAYGADSPRGSHSDEVRKDYGLKWRPSIFMPRRASRLTLRITDVRVQRLQDISEDDALAEGIDVGAMNAANCASFRAGTHNRLLAFEYRSLWESINGAGSWDANPWVWALTFDVIQRNIDAVLLELANAPETTR